MSSDFPGPFGYVSPVFAEMHNDLVELWHTEGPDAVAERVNELSYDTLANFMMLHTGKAALLSKK